MNSTGGKGPLPAGVATSTGTSVPSADLIVALLSSTALAKVGAPSADAKMAAAMTSLFMVLSCLFSGLHSRPARLISCAVRKYAAGDAYPAGQEYAGGYGYP